MVAVIGRWSLFGGDRKLRFDCSYTSIDTYLFLDAILKCCVLRESVNKHYFVNQQVKLFKNHQFCIKNQKVAKLVFLSVYNVIQPIHLCHTACF